jgi:diguanylate cyclase
MNEPMESDRWNMNRISHAYVVLAAVGVVVHLVLRTAQQRYLLYAAVGILAAFALGLSVIVLRLERRLWIPTVATFTLVGVAHLMHPDDADTVVSTGSEILFQLAGLLGLTIIVVTLAGLVRARSYEHLDGVLADASILALGAWIVGWVFVSPGHFGGESVPTVLAVGRGLAQPLAVMVLFLLVTVALADRKRSRSLVLLFLAVAAVLVEQTAHSVSVSTHHHVSERVMNAPLVFAALIAAAGLLHPSVRGLFAPHGAVPSRPLLVRLLITTTAMVLPIVALSTSDPTSTTDRVVRLVSASVLALAVMWRVVNAVRANEDAQRELVRSARTDPLTKLPNRELILEHIARALSDAWRTNRRPTVLFIDVDRFKNVNDSLGHAVGDAVLRAVAERLIAVLPDRAVIGRISGDEFVVVDPDTRNPAEALALAERAWTVFREPLPLRQGDVFISASIGVANANPTSTSKADDLLRQADTAMYRAKDAGRNQIAVFDDTMHERVSQRLAMETALYRALERRELRLFHQPILDLDEGQVIGFEALMRWEQADGTLVSPADFIPSPRRRGPSCRSVHGRCWRPSPICAPGPRRASAPPAARCRSTCHPANCTTRTSSRWSTRPSAGRGCLANGCGSR